MDDLIRRKDAIDAVRGRFSMPVDNLIVEVIGNLPSAQPERLKDDDFETIRIHLNAYKESLCNQRRWKEAEEYQRIINRFMAFAAQPERKCGEWINDKGLYRKKCAFARIAERICGKEKNDVGRYLSSVSTIRER